MICTDRAGTACAVPGWRTATLLLMCQGCSNFSVTCRAPIAKAQVMSECWVFFHFLFPLMLFPLPSCVLLPGADLTWCRALPNPACISGSSLFIRNELWHWNSVLPMSCQNLDVTCLVQLIFYPKHCPPHPPLPTLPSFQKGEMTK